MAKIEKREHYNTLKDFKGQKYTGMSIGGTHSWKYDNGIWNEMKISPTQWNFEFVCAKNRMHQAPVGTGALTGTEYHWYVIADQKVIKIDENTYRTIMLGAKFKVGHKRPNWKNWSYNYKHISYEDIIIEILQSIIDKLKAKKQVKELTHFF